MTTEDNVIAQNSKVMANLECCILDNINYATYLQRIFKEETVHVEKTDASIDLRKQFIKISKSQEEKENVQRQIEELEKTKIDQLRRYKKAEEMLLKHKESWNRFKKDLIALAKDVEYVDL